MVACGISFFYSEDLGCCFTYSLRLSFSWNSQGDRCSYLLDCVAWFLCSTPFLTYRLSGWTLQWVGCPQIGSLGSIPLCWRREDPPLLLGEMLCRETRPYAEKSNTLCLYSRVPLSPFDATVPSLTQWDTLPGDGNLLASAALNLGLNWLFTKSLMLAASPRQTLPVSVPSQELEWQPSGMCGLSGREPEVY